MNHHSWLPAQPLYIICVVSHFYRTAHEIWACFRPVLLYIDFEPNLEMAIDVLKSALLLYFSDNIRPMKTLAPVCMEISFSKRH